MSRRGYRFIGEAASSQYSVVSNPLPQPTPFPLAPNTQHPTPTLVGREEELAQLHRWLDLALTGQRQIVFVSGEPGIGKTTLVDAFLQQIQETRVPEAKESQNAKTQKSKIGNSSLAPSSQPPAPVFIGRGQCLEQYGDGEAYLPILEAFGRLCREPETTNLIPLLGQYAPTWLIQMPAVLNDAELANLQQRTQGATRQRMLREMVEAIEAMTVETPLVFVLEDLHWSDYSTLELLAYLAQRQGRMRLLVIGTYRPTALRRGHPLKTIKPELHIRQKCEELPLQLFSEQEVAIVSCQTISHACSLARARQGDSSSDGREPVIHGEPAQ